MCHTNTHMNTHTHASHIQTPRDYFLFTVISKIITINNKNETAHTKKTHTHTYKLYKLIHDLSYKEQHIFHHPMFPFPNNENSNNKLIWYRYGCKKNEMEKENRNIERKFIGKNIQADTTWVHACICWIFTRITQHHIYYIWDLRCIFHFDKRHFPIFV